MGERVGVKPDIGDCCLQAFYISAPKRWLNYTTRRALEFLWHTLVAFPYLINFDSLTTNPCINQHSLKRRQVGNISLQQQCSSIQLSLLWKVVKQNDTEVTSFCIQFEKLWRGFWGKLVRVRGSGLFSFKTMYAIDFRLRHYLKPLACWVTLKDE